MEKSQNVIVILVDAVRARNLGCYGAPENSSPNIDRLAEEGVLFENAYSCINTTDASLTSIFSGKYPRSHGIMNHGERISLEEIRNFNNSGLRVLPEILKAKGYRTLAVDWLGRWHRRGYDYYEHQPDRGFFGRLRYYLFELPGLYIAYLLRHVNIIKQYAHKAPIAFSSFFKSLRDLLRTFAFSLELIKIQNGQLVADQAIDLIEENRDRNFFLFIHFWDTHAPYNSPFRLIEPSEKSIRKKTGKFRRGFTKFFRSWGINSGVDAEIARYKGAIRYVDQQIGRLMKVLNKERLLDNTLIVLTSDHGESLTEHEIYFDHHGLYDETIHVPLILRYPHKLPTNRRVRGLVQHIDLLPTILELFRIDERKGLDGRSLLPILNGQVDSVRSWCFFEEAYTQRKMGIRTERYKYIRALSKEGAVCRYCRSVHGGEEELYDLVNDPRETRNIVKEKSAEAEKLRGQLAQIVAQLEVKRETERHPTEGLKQFDIEETKVKKRLRSLGYFD